MSKKEELKIRNFKFAKPKGDTTGTRKWLFDVTAKDIAMLVAVFAIFGGMFFLAIQFVQMSEKSVVGMARLESSSIIYGHNIKVTEKDLQGSSISQKNGQNYITIAGEDYKYKLDGNNYIMIDVGTSNAPNYQNIITENNLDYVSLGGSQGWISNSIPYENMVKNAPVAPSSGSTSNSPPRTESITSSTPLAPLPTSTQGSSSIESSGVSEYSSAQVSDIFKNANFKGVGIDGNMYYTSGSHKLIITPTGSVYEEIETSSPVAEESGTGNVAPTLTSYNKLAIDNSIWPWSPTTDVNIANAQDKGWQDKWKVNNIVPSLTTSTPSVIAAYKKGIEERTAQVKSINEVMNTQSALTAEDKTKFKAQLDKINNELNAYNNGLNSYQNLNLNQQNAPTVSSNLGSQIQSLDQRITAYEKVGVDASALKTERQNLATIKSQYDAAISSGSAAGGNGAAEGSDDLGDLAALFTEEDLVENTAEVPAFSDLKKGMPLMVSVDGKPSVKYTFDKFDEKGNAILLDENGKPTDPISSDEYDDLSYFGAISAPPAQNAPAQTPSAQITNMLRASDDSVIYYNPSKGLLSDPGNTYDTNIVISLVTIYGKTYYATDVPNPGGGTTSYLSSTPPDLINGEYGEKINLVVGSDGSNDGTYTTPDSFKSQFSGNTNFVIDGTNDGDLTLNSLNTFLGEDGKNDVFFDQYGTRVDGPVANGYGVSAFTIDGQVKYVSIKYDDKGQQMANQASISDKLPTSINDLGSSLGIPQNGAYVINGKPVTFSNDNKGDNRISTTLNTNAGWNNFNPDSVKGTAAGDAVLQVLSDKQGKYNSILISNPNVAFGLVMQESSGRPGIVSDAGAIGLSQVMPGTAWDMIYHDGSKPQQRVPQNQGESDKEWARRVADYIKQDKQIDLFDPKTNAELGLNYFNQQLNDATRLNPNSNQDDIIRVALARYFAGPNAGINTVADLEKKGADKTDVNGQNALRYANEALTKMKRFSGLTPEQAAEEIKSTNTNYNSLKALMDQGYTPEMIAQMFPNGISPGQTINIGVDISKLKKTDYIDSKGNPIFLSEEGKYITLSVSENSVTTAPVSGKGKQVKQVTPALQTIQMINFDNNKVTLLDEYFVSASGQEYKVEKGEFDYMGGIKDPNTPITAEKDGSGNLVLGVSGPAGGHTVTYQNYDDKNFDKNGVYMGTLTKSDTKLESRYYDEDGNSVTAEKFEENKNAKPEDQKKYIEVKDMKSTITTVKEYKDMVSGEYINDRVEIKDGQIVQRWAEGSLVNDKGEETFTVYAQNENGDKLDAKYIYNCGKYGGCGDAACVGADCEKITAEQREFMDKQAKQYGHRRFFGDMERSFTQFRGLGGYSSLFIDSGTLQAWREGVDEVFAKMYLGTEYWSSKICSSKIETASDGLAYVNTPDGLIGVAAHIEGEKINEMNPMNKTPRYIYKISYFVQNHKSSIVSEGFRSKDEKMKFNVEVRGPSGKKQIYDQDIELATGAVKKISKDQMIVKESPYTYDKVCIVFTTPIKTVGSNFATESRDEICNKFSTYQGGATQVQVATTSAGGTGGQAQITSDW